ncbi:uncharacterized protein CC84DRAFT_1213969 [Paraphaeosphaeria sporulosa]|uniref:Uncharacterized protein n=1 Tax=Paraphaeosphaeria sporulosa TaxID=1460663 RepID=A0A177CT08_9PLEO|nr:uncharacterized protein CC84DRAFT_1213969 [Paraphaeosphaeria sporulosa]OAG10663.1 hypothetical protein CC84DRAFT_1213969 [Paraphaeosphaeria sporulosa]
MDDKTRKRNESDDDEHDNAVSERCRPEKIRCITTMQTPDVSPRQDEDLVNAGGGTKSASVSNKLGVQHAAADDHNLHARAQESIAGTGPSITRSNIETGRDNIENRDSRGELSWRELPPATYEANELCRTEKYKRENMRFEKVHDGALARSFAEGRPLLMYWEDSKLVRSMRNRRPRTVCETPETAATLKNARNQAPLEGQGRKISLSSVFPIRPPAPEDEVDSLNLDGSGLWPIGNASADGSSTYLPEPRIGRPPLAPVPWPRITLPVRLQTVRRSTSHPAQGRSPRALRELYLSRYHAACRMEEKMSEEDMSVFVGFDTEQ